MTLPHRLFSLGPFSRPQSAKARGWDTAPSRRDCLRALAVVPSLALPTGARAAPSAPSGHLWLTLFAGPAGGPVFWLTRGTEFIVVDGIATPVRGRISAIAAVARPREGGSMRVSYLLQGVSVTPTAFDHAPKLVHPITGEETSTAVTPPLKLGWMLDSQGKFTEALVAANGTRATYRGETWDSPSTGDAPSATVKMNIRLDRPNGTVETFNEVSQIRRRPGGSAEPSKVGVTTTGDEFIPAESETFTVHPLPDPAKYKGTTALSMSMNHGTNYRSADALRAFMRPADVGVLGGFFEALEGWLKEL